MPNARRTRSAVYQRTRALVFQAGGAGASAQDIAADDAFRHHEQPESAVRRAMIELLTEDVIEVIDPDERPVVVRWKDGRIEP